MNEVDYVNTRARQPARRISVPFSAIVPLALAVTLGACGSDTPGPTAPTTGASTPAPAPPSSSAAGCDRTAIGVAPLNDLRDTYKGEAGGLYPGGSNTAPASH